MRYKIYLIVISVQFRIVEIKVGIANLWCHFIQLANCSFLCNRIHPRILSKHCAEAISNIFDLYKFVSILVQNFFHQK